MDSEKKVSFLWLLGTALVSGACLSLCFPGFNLSGFVWVWMLPLLPALWQCRNKKQGFSIGYLSGLVFWLINLKWLWTVSGLGAMGLAAFLSLYFGLFGMIACSLGNPWRIRERKKKAKKDLSNSIEQKIAQKNAEQLSSRAAKNAVLGGALADSLRSLRFALINAAAWVGIEWLRGWLFTGFGWNGLGVAFHNTPLLAQAADLVGVTGLAFTPVFMSAVLVQTSRRLATEMRAGKLKPRLDFGVAALLLAVQFCYGVWRVRDVVDWETQRVRVLLVQENIPQTLKWDPSAVVQIMDGYRDSTEAALSSLDKENIENLKNNTDGEPIEMKQPDLVVWPESAVPNPLLFIKEEKNKYYFYDDVRHLLEKEILPLGHFTLIAGMNEFEAEIENEMLRFKQEGEQYNSLVIVPSQGELGESTQAYQKLHLVIFGEYIPLKEELPVLKKLFRFSAGADFSGNFTAGTSTEPLEIKAGNAQVQVIPNVCFEDTVGRLTRKFVRKKPQVIVNVTNDGWFKKSEAAEQHMANAKFRAIELRRPMIRSANTGVSAIISVTGSVVDPVTGDRQVIEDASGSHFTRDSLYGHAYAPKEGGITLYAMASDWFSWLMIFTVVLFAVRSKIKA